MILVMFFVKPHRKHTFKSYSLMHLLKDNHFVSLSRRQLSHFLQETLGDTSLWLALFKEPDNANRAFSLLDELPLAEQAKLLLQNNVFDYADTNELKLELLRKINALPSQDKVIFYNEFIKKPNIKEFLSQQKPEVRFYFALFAVEHVKNILKLEDTFNNNWFDRIADTAADIQSSENKSPERMNALAYRWYLHTKSLDNDPDSILSYCLAWPFPLGEMPSIDQYSDNYFNTEMVNYRIDSLDMDKSLLSNMYYKIMKTDISSNEKASLRMHWLSYIDNVKQGLNQLKQIKLLIKTSTYHEEKGIAVCERLSNLMWIYDPNELDKLVPCKPRKPTPADELKQWLSDYMLDNFADPFGSPILQYFEQLKELNEDNQSSILDLTFNNESVAMYFSHRLNDSKHWNELIDQLSDTDTRQNALQALTAIWQHLPKEEQIESVNALLVTRESEEDKSRLNSLVTSPDFWHMMNSALREASPQLFEALMSRVVIPFESNIPAQLKQTIANYRTQQTIYPLLSAIQSNMKDDYKGLFWQRLRQPIAPPDTPSIEELSALLSKNLLYEVMRYYNKDLTMAFIALIKKLPQEDKKRLVDFSALKIAFDGNPDCSCELMELIKKLPDEEKQKMFDNLDILDIRRLYIRTSEQLITLFNLVIECKDETKNTQMVLCLLSYFNTFPSQLNKLLDWIKTLGKKEQLAILKSYEFSYLLSNKSPQAKEFCANLLVFVRTLPIEDQGTVMPPSSFPSIEPSATPQVFLDVALIHLAKKAHEFKIKAEHFSQKKQHTYYAKNIRYSDYALALYRECDELIRRDYFDVAAWETLISRARHDFRSEKSVLDLITIIDTKQREIQREFIQKSYANWKDKIPNNTDKVINTDYLSRQDIIETYSANAATLEKIKTSRGNLQYFFFKRMNEDSALRNELNQLIKDDPIAKLNFHLIELMQKISSTPPDENRGLNKLYRQLNFLLEEHAKALKENNIKNLNEIPVLWDKCLEDAKPWFKTRLNFFTPSSNTDALWSELKRSKPEIKSATIPVASKKAQFFNKPRPVKSTLSDANNDLMYNQIAKNITLDKVREVSREELKYIPTSPGKHPSGLALALQKHQTDNLLFIVPLIHDLDDAERALILASCDSLLTKKTIEAFTPYSDKMRDLCQLELERIIQSLGLKAPDSRLLSTLNKLKQTIINKDGDFCHAISDAQITLKKQTSWSTWIGISRTATARRDTHRLLDTMLQTAYLPTLSVKKN